MKLRPASSVALIRPLLLALVALGLLMVCAAGAQAATLVVDDDAAQCPNAGYTTIQAAVDHAQAGDMIRVCPGVYHETVTVDKPVRLQGDPDVVAALDCFAPELGAADPTQQAIIDGTGSGGGFSEAFRLRADDVSVRGLVVQGFSVGVDAADRFSGYRIDHNLIRDNTLFGIDFGSQGTVQSRVDHNCLRGNGWAVASELDDDTLWKPSSGGPERGQWNARNLTNARIDHNATTGNTGYGGGALQITGPGRRVRVTIDHNLTRQDLGGILLTDSTDSAIVHNDVIDELGNAIVIGGGTEHLLIADNRVRNAGLASPQAGAGIFFINTFLDPFPIPNHDIVVTHNEVTGALFGIDVKENNLADSLIADNTLSDNRGHGIFIRVGDTGNVIRHNRANDNGFAGILLNVDTTGNVVRDNQTDRNGISGITAVLSATGNRFEDNSMHGNGWRTDTTLPRADARDLNPLLNGALQNVWIGNDCDTDIPAGMICGIG